MATATDTSLGFAVEGIPVPQGSKRLGRHGGRPVILDDNDVDLRAWRKAIASAFKIAAGDEWAPLDEPVAVAVAFYFDRPKTRKTETAKATAPDIDKLSRAVLDGLADGGAYVNDGRVVALAAYKQYVTELHPVVGAAIYLRVTDTPPYVAVTNAMRCNYDRHVCHFCGANLTHDSMETVAGGKARHWLSDCRPDLIDGSYDGGKTVHTDGPMA